MSHHLNQNQTQNNNILDSECHTVSPLLEHGGPATGNSSNSLETLYRPNNPPQQYRDNIGSSSDTGSSMQSSSSDLIESQKSVQNDSSAHQSELRKQIIIIQGDSTIPANEKSKRIQV